MSLIKCDVCFDESELKIISCKKGHNLCINCFEIQIDSQLSPESIGQFEENRQILMCSFCSKITNEESINIECMYCQEEYPDEKICCYESYCDSKINKIFGRRILKNIQDKVNRVKHDIEQIKIRTIIENEFNQKVNETLIEIQKRKCLEMLNVRCPHCEKVFVDFDACCAVKCSCNVHFCAWCLDFNSFNQDETHEHVKHCSESLKQGHYYGTKEQITSVWNKIKAKKIVKQLNKLDDEKLTVYDGIKNELNGLNILYNSITKEFYYQQPVKSNIYEPIKKRSCRRHIEQPIIEHKVLRELTNVTHLKSFVGGHNNLDNWFGNDNLDNYIEHDFVNVNVLERW